jgi:hypothetical protein
MNPTDTMVNAALEALEGRMIDGRKFWTDEDRLLMKAAIRAAIMADLVVLSALADALSYTDLRASGGLARAP